MGLIFSLFMFYLKSKPWSLEPVKTLLGRSSRLMILWISGTLIFCTHKRKSKLLIDSRVSVCWHTTLDEHSVMSHNYTQIYSFKHIYSFQSISTCIGMKKMTTIQIFLRQVSSLGGHLGYTPRQHFLTKQYAHKYPILYFSEKRPRCHCFVIPHLTCRGQRGDGLTSLTTSVPFSLVSNWLFQDK